MLREECIHCNPALAPVGDVQDALDVPLRVWFNTGVRMNCLVSLNTPTWEDAACENVDKHSPAMFAVELWDQHKSVLNGIAQKTNTVEGWLTASSHCFIVIILRWWCFWLVRCKTWWSKRLVFYIHPTRNILACKLVSSMPYGEADVLVFPRALAHLSHSI